jgi:hypothetical protein
VHKGFFAQTFASAFVGFLGVLIDIPLRRHTNQPLCFGKRTVPNSLLGPLTSTLPPKRSLLKQRLALCSSSLASHHFCSSQFNPTGESNVAVILPGRAV